jgi:hypothetical protein
MQINTFANVPVAKFIITAVTAVTAVTAGTLAVAAMGSTGAAGAAPSGPGNAQDIVNSLIAQGYTVQLNGTPDDPLSDCTVTGIHGLSNSDSAAGRAPATFTTAYVDISCPDDH